MPDRRRQRQQRVRQEAGGGGADPRSVGASNRDAVKEESAPNTAPNRSQKHGGTGVAYAEPKQYESVTIMPDKEVTEPQKYQRREILSNWLRYEDLPPEEVEDGEDYLVGEDFSTILEQQVNTGGHLILKGESLWDDTETSILKSHGLGALHVSDLVAAINTIPLQVQLNIPESSLPDSVIEFYSNLAEDNKKLYQPSNNYNDCMEVNEKILQSLKLSDNEPLNLAADAVENQTNITNAVDVALSLTSAFAPEPDDVDLDLLIQETSPEKSVEREKEPSPFKEPSPNKEPSPIKEPSPLKEPSPSLQPSADNQPGIAKRPSPDKQFVPEKQPSPAPNVKIEPSQKSNQREKSKEKSPATFDFGLPKSSASNTTLNFGLPKTDISSNIQTNSVVANALKDVDLGNFSKVEDKAPEGPTIDLDAPVTQSKPVLLISKTEEADLEDWLDSVLDD